jgi:hypothetical protein
VNEEALAHWGTVAPKTNKETNKQNGKYFFIIIEARRPNIRLPGKTPIRAAHN